ncbi:oxidoreductase [Penicillium angulare]|uniref:Oxidoreductase n=1 Tax=Penicillium angulare TaxID=116970 RepID=A0A9W9FAP0_9EURO|nr:oxidoreductase [Penicillium angulare]
MNAAGEWIAVPPRPGSIIVNVGMQLEAMTDGVCCAALHRVLTRPRDFVDDEGNSRGARFSFPFFDNMGLDVRREKPLNIPPHISALVTNGEASRNARIVVRRMFQRGCTGEGIFGTRVRLHQKVTEKWYPELLAEIQEMAEKPGSSSG